MEPTTIVICIGIILGSFLHSGPKQSDLKDTSSEIKIEHTTKK